MPHTRIEGFPAEVRITEVGPRDGLQALPDWVPTEAKIAMVNDLIAAGLRQFEVSSFVSPRAVPQMRDAAEVFAGIDRGKGAELTALVPNARGAARAVEAGVDAMVVFLSASESHNQANVNCSRETSLTAFREICRIGEEAGIPVQGAIATAFGCPFEGDVPVTAITELARAYADMGITRISLGDTTGMATPLLVQERCRALKREVPEAAITLHFHNTRGVGLACVYAGLLEGITRYESSLGGLGGCPFAPGATGNICTEDLVYLLEESGVATGVDLEAVFAVARRMEKILDRPLPGQVMKAGPRLTLHRRDAVPCAAG
ncbi:hydroxymethylglutaryl-CoA lyase [Aquicoccus sp. SU-CL01552]|uniref:hydroxymethylglutaryl-CoA lyase n=1 Tax=Aquicoccus sp. SU-CL01552 TaxID=3127656 RepID=UPI0031036274